MRCTALIAIVTGLSAVYCPVAAASPEPATCSIVGKTYDSKDVLCVIPRAESARHPEFVARFSGGHDDTQVSIETTLNGQPLACEAGSKKDLTGEDGNVKLYCRFSVDPAPGDEARLKVTIHWSHAEYTDYQLMDR